MDYTFLRMLAVPSKTNHSKSFGMDLSPIIIGTINVSLSHILAIHPIEFSQYHFQWQTQPYAHTTFHILLLPTSCIRPNGCANIPYHVFSCTLSVLTYCNHSLCAEHSPHVFHIICI